MRSRILICAIAAAAAVPIQGQMWFRAPRAYDNMPGEFRAVGDLDGDGDQDVIRLEGANAVRVMWNDGTGQLLPGPVSPIAASSPDPILCVDVTGDGVKDLVFASGASILVHPGLGGGT